METKEFTLDPTSRYCVIGMKYRHVLDEGWLIDENDQEVLVYTNGTHIGYNDLVWRIPYHFKEPECKQVNMCENTNLVTVDILVA